MRTHPSTLWFVLIALAIWMTSHLDSIGADKPNLIVILTDDLKKALSLSNFAACWQR